MELGGSIARTALALQQVEDSHEFATLHADGIAHTCRLGAAHVDGAGSRTEAMAWHVEIRRVDDGWGIENLLVDLHALLLSGSRDERIHEVLLQLAVVYAERLACQGLAEEVLMQHIHHFYGSECIPAVVLLVGKHAHDAAVVEHIPEHVALLVLQCIVWRLLLHAQRRILVDEGILVELASEEPLRTGEHLVDEELHGSLLLILLHEGEGWLSIVDGGVVDVHTAHIGEYMVEVETPLEDDALIELRCLIVGLTRFACAGPIDDVRHHALQVGDAIGSRLHGVIAQILAQGTWVDGGALALRLAVSEFLSAVLLQEILLC